MPPYLENNSTPTATIHSAFDFCHLVNPLPGVLGHLNSLHHSTGASWPQSTKALLMAQAAPFPPPRGQPLGIDPNCL